MFATWKEEIERLGCTEDQFLSKKKQKQIEKKKTSDFLKAQQKQEKKAKSTAKANNNVNSAKSLFNKVVRRNIPDGGGYEYWYVLTYLPDLQWLHLAPLIKKGVFEEHRKNSAGRTKWMLVAEEEGKEVDTGAAECEIIKSRAVRHVSDADDEEWDILIEQHEEALEKKKEKKEKGGKKKKKKKKGGKHTWEDTAAD